MLKNILALVGATVLLKAAYEHYEEFRALKREKAEREGGSA